MRAMMIELPDPKHEAWLHARVKDLAKADWSEPTGTAPVPDLDLGLPRIVIRDGQVETNGTLDGWADNPLATIGEALVVTEPCHILHIGSGHHATRVRVDTPGPVVESFHGTGVRLATTEVASGGHYVAIADHAGHHAHSITTHVGADEHLTVHDVRLRGPWTRVTLEARLAGRGGHVDLNGLFMAKGDEHTDAYTRIDHAAPDTTSAENYKGILAGHGHGAFTGNILVREGASNVNSDQQNRNLLLSRNATVDTTPQLEIHNDDVQCAHGSTVGQLDEDALFFMRSRGIPDEQARRILTQAFADEVFTALPEAVRVWCHDQVAAWFQEVS